MWQSHTAPGRNPIWCNLQQLACANVEHYCEVVTSDPEMQCCGHELSTPFVAVVKIWVTVNGTKTIFKYTFSQYLQLFEQYNISLKLVNVQ